jgi:hypothetical protein
MSREVGANRWKVLAPDANVDLSESPDSLTCNTDLTVVLAGQDDVEATFTLTAGAVYPYRPKRVISVTGGDLIGLFNATV